jgi:hypothetical protein
MPVLLVAARPWYSAWSSVTKQYAGSKIGTGWQGDGSWDCTIICMLSA